MQVSIHNDYDVIVRCLNPRQHGGREPFLVLSSYDPNPITVWLLRRDLPRFVRAIIINNDDLKRIAQWFHRTMDSFQKFGDVFPLIVGRDYYGRVVIRH